MNDTTTSPESDARSAATSESAEKKRRERFPRLAFPGKRSAMRSKQIKVAHLIPNLLTSFNVACGVSAILFAVMGRFDLAAILILAAAFFDMIDGKVARLVGNESQFGAQFDSLADAISFGVAPPLLMHSILYQDYDRLGLSMVLIYTLCTTLRLARFNTQASAHVKRRFFIGLPCPVPACFFAALVWVFMDYAHLTADGVLALSLPLLGTFDMHHPMSRGVIHAMVVLAACLMVSTIRYPDVSAIRVDRRNIYAYTVFLVLLLSVTVLIEKMMILLLTGAAILSGPAYMFWRRRSQTIHETEDALLEAKRPGSEESTSNG